MKKRLFENSFIGMWIVAGLMILWVIFNGYPL